MTQFLTVSYKIRTPTAFKSDVLHTAATLYTESAQSLLDWALLNLDHITENGRMTTKDGSALEKYNGDSVRKTFPTMAELKLPLSSMVNEALINDICSVVAGYIEACKVEPRTQFPKTIPEIMDREIVLSELALLADNQDRENELFHELMRREKSKYRPISYIRARDFAILCKAGEPDNLYAWLPLLPGDNTIIPKYIFDGSMIELGAGEPFKRKSAMGIIVSLYTPHKSRWYDKFFSRIMDGSAKIKSAKLSLVDDGWKLNVSVAFETNESYSHTSYLGVSVGNMDRISYAVTDLDGKVIREVSDEYDISSANARNRRSVAKRQRDGRFVDIAHYRNQSQVEMLHLIADRIIADAKSHQAMIVLQDFKENKGSGQFLGMKGRKRKIVAPWRRFEFIISYKANLAGVPIRTSMWSAQSEYICPECGSACKSLEEHHYQIVECASCSMRNYKSIVASINLCRRMNYKKAQWDGKGGYMSFHVATANKLRRVQS